MHRATLPLAALLLLGLLGVWWFGGEPTSPSVPPSEMVWAPFQPDDVARVHFIDKSEVGTVLARTAQGWTLQPPGSAPVPAVDVPARAVALALSGLTSVRQIETDAPAEEYGLGTSALRVRVTLAEGSTRELVIGDAVPIGEGRYVLSGDGAIRVAPDGPLAVLMRDPLDLLPPASQVP